LGHRALALLLALLMVFTATGMQVFADEDSSEPVAEETQTETTVVTEPEPTTEQTNTEETPATTDTVTEETPAETTPSETPEQTTDVETTETPAEPTSTVETTEPSTEPTETPAETQDATTTPPDPYDITNKITESAMTVSTDGGDTYQDYTKLDPIPLTALVKVTMDFEKIDDILPDQVLVYEIPDKLSVNTVVTPTDVSYTYQDSTGATQSIKIGTYTIDQKQKITIVPDQSYLNEETGCVELPGGHIAFSGSLGWDVEPGNLTITLGKSDPISITVTDEEEDETTEEQPAPSTPLYVQARAASGTYDITSFLTSDSFIHVYIGEDELTLDELDASGKQVPEGASVRVKLNFNRITDIPAGDTLIYKIPSALVVQAATTPTKLLDTQYNETLGSFVIDENGLITVTIDEAYHTKHQHSDGTLDLDGFNLYFSGSFSNEMGQEDGSNDNVIHFSGTAGSTDVSFTIPFDYKNDHANVQIEKTGAFTSATTIKYTVTVKAPDDNTEDAYNVVVTDNITSAKSFVEADSNGNLYRNYTVTNGSFDPATGVWTISGNMTPGQTETLTYELQVSNKYYTDNAGGEVVGNTATVTFNECGQNDAVNTVAATGTVLLDKEYNNSLGMVKDDKGTYITYTLTATAYSADQTGVVVKDAFTSTNMISFVEEESKTQGDVVIGDDKKSLTWTVGSLAEGTSATLTYRAYLNDAAWESGATYDSLFQWLSSSKQVKNTATVSVNNVPGGTDAVPVEPLVTDTKSTVTTLQKKWLIKDSSLIENENSAHNGTVQFTIKANPAPSSDDIDTIWDRLTDGTYEADGVITIKRYLASSNSTTLVDTYEVKVSDVLDAGSDTSCTIHLAEVPTTEGKKDLSGAYYYEVSYYVVAAGASVTNLAGLGLGDGAGFQITKVAQGTAGWTQGSHYTKWKSGDINYKDGTVGFVAEIYKTVNEDTELADHLSSNFSYGYNWYDEDCFNDMVVTFDGETLVRGVDYEIRGCTHWQNNISTEKDCYRGYYLQFLHTIEASKSKPIRVTYYTKVNTTAKNAGAGNMWCGNYIDMHYKVNNEWVYASTRHSGDPVWGGDVAPNTPLTKTNGTYHEESGTITWDINVNQVDSVGGNATLIDLLPDGLTFVSAEITEMGEAASKIGTTVNGKTLHETITAEDVEVDENYTENNTKYTKVTFSVENLSRFQKVENDTLVENTSQTTKGRVVVTITAKVDPSILASLDSNKTVTNKAILTDNDYLPTGGVSATNNATIPATGSTVVSKSQATQESPAYVQFALNINSNALDLVADDGTLTVDDVMGTGMTMATSHENCFKVYDVTGVTAEWSSEGASLAEQAANLGTDITKSCSWEATEEANTYRFTVPDGKHVVIVYWAVFSGVEGQTVSLTNNAYFFYEGHDYSNNASKWQASLQVGGAGGDAYTNPYFYLQKQDQWGNNVSGATFAVYEYDRTTGKDGEKVAERTTENGQAYIGHRATDNNNTFPILSLNTIYGIKEIEAPAGYTLDSTEHYFEFINLRDSDGNVSDDAIKKHQESHPEGITVIDLSPGGTYTVTNHFAGASATIPVAKTINGKNLSSTTDFSFTLQQITSDDGSKLTVYTDEDYKGTLPTTGLKKTITGSGSDYFDPLYFKETGTYTFSLTEDSLSSVAQNHGFSEENRDQTEYKVTVVVSEVDKDGKKTIEVTKITYAGGTKSGDILQSDVPTFNNGLSLEGTLKLQVKKTVTGRAAEVAEGEFAFTVLNNGEAIKDQYGNALIFETENGGMVNISIPLTQDDIGDHDYVIKEVVPTTEDPSISYDASPVIASVTIGEVSGANGASVAAITDVTYTADQTEDGVPLMVNKYVASGSLKLQGTKKFLYGTQEQAISEGQFNFVVMEGNTQVATGTTKSGYQDNIEFTEINYVAADIGKHTYTISEVNDGQMFVEYTDKVVTVNVEVKDAGDGKLEAVATYEGDTDDKDISGHALFVNTCTFIIPSGIRLDVLPYVLIVLLALGCGALLLRRRKHMRG
jgi:pilin isopeptide linkage protein